MAQQQRIRTIAGRPMTPDLLARTGGLNAFPETPASYDPGGAWVNKYRIHICHGYVEDLNQDVGVLRLERIPESGREFTMKIRQRIVNDEGHTHYTEVLARCRPDSLGSPAQWQLTNWFEDRVGRKMPGTGREESGTIEGGAVKIVHGRGGQTTVRDCANEVTSDWTLFEAVQRLEFAATAWPVFDFLEGFSVLRHGHRLTYRGVYKMEARKRPPLYWFQQTGSGVLPYEYWLDARHRLLVAATQARAYVLDDAADEAVNKRLNAIRQQKAKRRNG